MIDPDDLSQLQYVIITANELYIEVVGCFEALSVVLRLCCFEFMVATIFCSAGVL